MNSLIALCADYYWEQDTEYRFTRLDATRAHPGIDAGCLQQAVGKAPWAVAGLACAAHEWHEFQNIVAQRAPFRDAEWTWTMGAALACVLTVSGEPAFDGNGSFIGYRGVMREITAHKRGDEELRRFREAIDVSGDPIFLLDRGTMRFIDVNWAACDACGYSREELLTMGPQDLLLCDRETLERGFDEVIAAGRRGMIIESAGRNREGEVRRYEMQRRAICFEGRWVIVSIARDITRRKLAEESAVRLGQMYAAISGTNEAILHARTPDALYREVCEVAVRGGPIVSASVLLHEPQSEWATVAAMAGIGTETLRSVRISFEENRPEGRGLVGTAFRSRASCVINDFDTDQRLQPWRHALGRESLAAGAAIPLLRNGQAAGVLLLYSQDKDAFDEQIVQLLERMARNIVFALENFERETERQHAVDALRESEEKYRSILENINDGYFEIDLKGTYTYVNQALSGLHKCTKEEALRLNYRDYTDAETRAALFKVFNQVFRTGQSGELAEYPVRRQDGTHCVAQTSMQLIVDANGTPIGFRGISRDVTARHQAEEALRASEERYRSILENIEEAYYEVDLSGNLLHCNDAFCRMFGYSMQELIGMNYADYHKPEDASFVYSQFNEVFRTGVPKKGIDWKLLHKSGNKLLCEGSIHLIRDANKEPIGFRGMLRDVTMRREMEERIRHLASHDILTGLPNRMMFNQVLSYQVQQAQRYARKFALMFIDLDHFKAVNDNFGHNAGDVLLKETAKRLTDSVRASDFVARLAGDEFVVIIQEMGDLNQLKAIAQKVVAAVRCPVVLGGAMHYVTASVGVCIFPDDGSDEEALLKHADAAMYRVKHSSKDNFRFYFQDC